MSKQMKCISDINTHTWSLSFRLSHIPLKNSIMFGIPTHGASLSFSLSHIPLKSSSMFGIELGTQLGILLSLGL